jgi:hypothetical protein
MTLLLKKPHVHRPFIINNASSPSYIRRKYSHSCYNKSNWFLKSSLSLISTSTSKKVVYSCIVMATKSSTESKSHNVKALVTVRQSDGRLIKNIVTGIVGNKHLFLELVSAELDPSKFHFIASTHMCMISIVLYSNIQTMVYLCFNNILFIKHEYVCTQNFGAPFIVTSKLSNHVKT